jgi:hypothetical protein
VAQGVDDTAAGGIGKGLEGVYLHHYVYTLYCM